jgi:hypothetical protein
MGSVLGITRHPANIAPFPAVVVNIEGRLYEQVRLHNLLSLQFGTGHPPEAIRRTCSMIESAFNEPSRPQERV